MVRNIQVFAITPGDLLCAGQRIKLKGGSAGIHR